MEMWLWRRVEGTRWMDEIWNEDVFNKSTRVEDYYMCIIKNKKVFKNTSKCKCNIQMYIEKKKMESGLEIS